jgi:hypothetical protein
MTQTIIIPQPNVFMRQAKPSRMETQMVTSYPGMVVDAAA